MTSHTRPDRKQQTPSQRTWGLPTLFIAVGLVAAGCAAWFLVDRKETNRLARDSRVVVRVPESVVDRLTPDEIREQYEIDESTGDMDVTGTADVVGRVSIEIEPHHEPEGHDDAMILVRVVGETDNDLIGVQSPIRILGDGRGEFEAVTEVHFDGRVFEASEDTQVDATHETEIVEVEPAPGTPLRGTVRLLASRKAREALPDLNALAAGRIEELVRERVDELVTGAVDELNRLNQFDETVARLHPDSDEWRIVVDSKDGYVQAALMPEGSSEPQVPTDEPKSLEVWMRLTRTQRTGLKLVSQWKQSHRLFKEFVPEEQARKIADDLTIATVGDWTRLRVGTRALQN